MSTPTFQIFWDRYGKKRERGDAEHAWHRLTADEQQAAIDGIAAYRQQCECQGIAMLYAQGYLNQRRWQKTRRQYGKKSANDTAATVRTDPFEEMEMW